MANRKKTALNNPLAVLRQSRNFSIYTGGMLISLIGSWMQNVAQPWLAYTLTGSPFLLSLISIMQFLPMLIFSLFSGVVIDRISKKKIMFFTQTALLMITGILAVLVWSGKVQYWHILACAIATGIVNTLDMPARQSFVIELVGKEYLHNAIAINSSIFNVARVLGPGIAGLVMAQLGVFACFAFNSVSFLAVIISLFFIKPMEVERIKRNEKIFHSIKEGLKYIAGNEIIIKTMASVFVISAFGMNMSTLLPVFAKTVLMQGEKGYGLLMSLMGVGSFIGSIFIASTSHGGPKGIILNIFPYLVAGMLAFISITRVYWLTGIGLVMTGFFFVCFTATANSTVQYNTHDKFRGRVMSVYSLISGGATPIGNAFTGVVTQGFGAPVGFLGCGTMIAVLIAATRLLRSKAQANRNAATEANAAARAIESDEKTKQGQ